MFFNRHLQRSRNYDTDDSALCNFHNDTQNAKTIRWVREDGTLDQPRRVDANMVHGESTFLGHAFALYSGDDTSDLLFTYVVDKPGVHEVYIGERRSTVAPISATTSHVYKTISLKRGLAECALDEELLDRDVQEFVRDCDAALSRIPLRILKMLKPCRFVVDRDGRGTTLRGCCYHPRDGGDWLEANGFPREELAGAIHIYRFSDYMEDRHLWGKGGVLVHELCHAVHDVLLRDGHRNALLEERFQQAAASLYSKVKVKKLHGGFDVQKHYACTDAAEFFAELSTAYLEPRSTELYNKWEPFNRPQLKVFDPVTHDLLERVWKRGDCLDVSSSSRSTSSGSRKRIRRWACCSS